jgi:hypothetical protein
MLTYITLLVMLLFTRNTIDARKSADVLFTVYTCTEIYILSRQLFFKDILHRFNSTIIPSLEPDIVLFFGGILDRPKPERYVPFALTRLWCIGFL